MNFANHTAPTQKWQGRLQIPGFAPAPLDWAGLRARLDAARALQAENAGEAGRASLRTGCFDRGAAALLGDSLRAAPDINRTDLADGKGGAGIAGAVAGQPAAGDRG